MKHLYNRASLAALHLMFAGALLGCKQPSAPDEAVTRDSAAAVRDSSSAVQAAAQPDCSTPPALVGVPTGNGPFSLNDGFYEGQQREFAFGDVILTDANEGGSAAVMIWGHNECGLWLRKSTGNSYISMEPYTFDPGVYQVLKPTEFGDYTMTDGFAKQMFSFMRSTERPADQVSVKALRTFEPKFREGD